MESSPTISVDGACQYVDGKVVCSVGVYWGDGDHRNLSYRVPCSTNNQAELIAAYIAIEQAHKLGYKEITIETDSLYVQRIFTQWITQWKKNNWRTYSRRPVKNAQLIQAIDNLASSLTVKYSWVRGHDRANIRNGAAHALASSAIYCPDAGSLEFDMQLIS